MGQTSITFVPERMLAARTRLGLTQEELAERSDLSTNSVGNAERGASISVSSAKAIADALETSVEELTGAASESDETAAKLRVACLPPGQAMLYGRQADLANLRALFCDHASDNGPRRIVVQGWPGVGKTALAKTICRSQSFHELYPDGVLWCSLGSAPSDPLVRQKLDAWATALDIAPTPALDNRHLANLIAGALIHLSVLLVIDDAFSASDAEQFLLGGDKCGTLITTRFPPVAQQLTSNPGDEYNLNIIDAEASFELLKKLAPKGVVDDNEALCREVIDTIERLPLSLQIIGRLLRAEIGKGKTAADVLNSVLESQRVILEHAPPSDIQSELGERAVSVMALLNLSTDALDENDRHYFMSLAPFAPKPAVFLEKDLSAIWGVDSIPILGRLVDRGLVEFIGDERYQIHSLLVAHAQNLANESE